jgi:hypothetical protein
MRSDMREEEMRTGMRGEEVRRDEGETLWMVGGIRQRKLYYFSIIERIS